MSIGSELADICYRSDEEGEEDPGKRPGRLMASAKRGVVSDGQNETGKGLGLEGWDGGRETA